jgi:hypothetical protein
MRHGGGPPNPLKVILSMRIVGRSADLRSGIWHTADRRKTRGLRVRILDGVDQPEACCMSALGHKRTLESGSGMSALPPEADVLIVGINVCYVPEADVEAEWDLVCLVHFSRGAL